MRKSLPCSDDLIRCVCVFNSHEDFSIYEAIYAGFDAEFNLIVVSEYSDSDEPQYNRASYAIVNKHEARKLARRLRVEPLALPGAIADAMSAWEDIVCPLPSDVRDCFKDITECLLDEGCRLRIVHAK